MLEILIKNGIYPDYEKKEMVEANIGIQDGKIAYIGQETPEAARVIEAEGKVVSPGFIDIHMHEEDFVHEGKQFIIANMMLEMGVTTAVGGNCGVQKQPLSIFKSVLNELGGSPVNYLILAGYNHFRIGHRQIRASVAGTDGRAAGNHEA